LALCTASPDGASKLLQPALTVPENEEQVRPWPDLLLMMIARVRPVTGVEEIRCLETV